MIWLGYLTVALVGGIVLYLALMVLFESRADRRDHDLWDAFQEGRIR